MQLSELYKLLSCSDMALVCKMISLLSCYSKCDAGVRVCSAQRLLMETLR